MTARKVRLNFYLLALDWVHLHNQLPSPAHNEKGYRAVVGHNGKLHHVGYFDTVEEASAAAEAKRIELFTHNDRDRV